MVQKEQLLQRYQVVSGAIEDLDDELASLLIYEEHKRTDYRINRTCASI